GGAGPLHAGDVARELGIPHVIVPTEPGTLCARGILHSDLSFDLVQTRIVIAAPERWAGIAKAFAESGGSAAEILDREPVPADGRRTLLGIDARYEGQNFEVPVALDGLDVGGAGGVVDAAFAGRFRAAHAEVYGYDIPGRAIEIVNLRLKIVGS